MKELIHRNPLKQVDSHMRFSQTNKILGVVE